jgi:glutamyl-tRNA synthetase
MPDPSVITRFAPSPTGYLHVGGARTALYNWLFARHSNGRYLLRIEDTDVARSTEQATQQLLEDLRWLGLNWDNDELVYQSRRRDVYDRIIDDLITRDLAYRAYETREELDVMRAGAERQKKQFVYRRRADITLEQIAAWQSEGRPHVVRFAMPVREYRFTDEVLGEIILPAEEAQDFVIRKSDGMPTYHFAVVVDDEAMGVTHVLRAQEHVKNTFNHIALMDALGYKRPKFAHLTTIQNPDGSKMGKRDRDKVVRQRAQEWIKRTSASTAQLSAACGLAEQRLTDWLKDSKKQLDIPEHESIMSTIAMRASELPEILVHDFRKNGYLPEVLLNFLALLGWSPGEDRERMTIDEMVRLFSIARIGKSNPRFDREKLKAFQTEAVASAPPERLLRGLKDYLAVNPESSLAGADDARLTKALSISAGFRTFRDVDDKCSPLFVADEAIAYEPDAVDKVLRRDGNAGLTVLRDLLPRLRGLDPWTTQSIDGAIKSFCEERSLGMGKVAQPLRVAATGGTISPAIGQSLELLGKPSTLARIERCLSLL